MKFLNFLNDTMQRFTIGNLTFGYESNINFETKIRARYYQPKVRSRWNSGFLFHFRFIRLTFYFIANYLTSCLSTPAKSAPESSPMKWLTVTPLTREKSLYSPSCRCILYNLLHPGGNVGSLISSNEFLNFTPIDITWCYCSGSTWSLAESHRDYGKNSEEILEDDFCFFVAVKCLIF